MCYILFIVYTSKVSLQPVYFIILIECGVLKCFKILKYISVKMQLNRPQTIYTKIDMCIREMELNLNTINVNHWCVQNNRG